MNKLGTVDKNNNNKKEKGKYYSKIFRATSANIFFCFLVAFLVGVIMRLLIKPTDLSVLILLVTLLISIIIFYFKYTNFKILFGVFILLGLIGGIIRTDLVIQRSINWVDIEYEGVGRVIKFAEPKDDYQRIYMEVMGQKINKQGIIINKKEVVLLFAPLGVNYEYGKTFELKCELKTAENKYEKFNYQRFLAGRKVYQICKRAKIGQQVEMENNGGEGLFSISNLTIQIQLAKTNFFGVIYKANKIIEDRINKLFSMPESAYLAGLLLGGDNRLPKKVAEDFRQTGTTHTVAVSGYNITILAGVFMYLGIFFGLWRKQAFWLATVGIIIFVIMIGAPSSAVRAGIMGIILLYAAQTGRLASSVRTITLTAVIMVFLAPFIILYDAGFQLSFLATLGIILIYGPLSEKFKIQNDFLELKSIILITISAQLGVLGVLIYTFDGVSLISLLANIIILPAIPIIMLGGVVAIGSSFIVDATGSLFALPTEMLLFLEIKSIELLAKIPWAMIEFDNASIFWAIGYYIILSIVLVGIK